MRGAVPPLPQLHFHGLVFGETQGQFYLLPLLLYILCQVLNISKFISGGICEFFACVLILRLVKFDMGQ
jgi:hypothetical protein